MKYLYTAIFTPMEDGSGFFCCVPDIPHCVTSGKDLADALAMIVDAANLMLVTYEDERLPIPAATDPRKLPLPENGVSSLIALDTDRYRILSDTRTVRKNVSLPAWMSILAEREGLSCSQVLQDALRQRLGVNGKQG